MAVKTHVAAPASTNSKGHQRNQFEKSCLLFVRARDPSGLALVPCTLRTVDKTNVAEMLTYTNIHTNTERKLFKASYPRMRSDMKGLFSLENQEKKAQRCALLVPHYKGVLLPFGGAGLLPLATSSPPKDWD